MSLPPGLRVGPYEIVSPLGAGGMGEVYRARDAKLQRDVAIKVLPEHLAGDRERLARFEREAQVLAALNHPHIAQIYGFEESPSTGSGQAGVRALVLELVEGETLAERIARGPVPLDEAVPIATQIAQALESAHEQGIIHRDLKPANIKISPAGVVKVLDFGLARLSESGDGSTASAIAMSPTITSPAMTQAGVILGTAAYMSPEQARGKTVDRRADIWAFGCVLFEMLTGRRAFDDGDTISDVVAAILKNDPDWNSLPAGVPARIRLLLRRCLEKDLKRRLPHIGLCRMEFDEPASDEAAGAARQPRAGWKRSLPIAAAATIAAVVAGSAMWALRTPAPTPRVMRFPIVLPESVALVSALRSIAVSPDGARIAFVASNRIYIRAVSELNAQPVPGSEFTGYLGDLAFSPDGETLAYWTGGGLDDATLKQIGIRGGTPVTITTASYPFGMTWGEDGVVFGQAGFNRTDGVQRANPNGGKPEVLVQISKNEVASNPQILPGGKAVLFTLASIGGLPEFVQDQWDRARVVVQDLDSGERKTIVSGGSDARYLSTGHLVYAVGTTIFAVPFDLDRLEVTGAVVSVLEGVARTGGEGAATGSTNLSVANDGTLIYLPGSATVSPKTRLAIIDPKTGQTTRLNPPDGNYESPRLSPDGTRVAVGVTSPTEANIWIYDLSGTSAIRQLTFGGKNRFPVWSHDGERVAFQSDREGALAIFWQRADGGSPAEPVTKPPGGTTHIPSAWSPDGQSLLIDVISPQGGGQGVRTLWRLSVADRTLEKFEGPTSNGVFAIAPSFSPDGKWVAYTSTEATGPRTYVQPFPVTGTKYFVGDGIHPFWSRDVKQLQLFYLPPPPGALTVVKVNTRGGFSLGNPELVKTRGYRVRGPLFERENDVLPDGRFLGVVAAATGEKPPAADTVPRLHIVVNWFEELRRLAPRK